MKNTFRNKNKLEAYTLPELLVVLIIVGILVLIALPNLMPLITKAKAVEAKQHLNHIYTLEQSYFYMNSKYSDDFNQIDYIAEKTVKDGGGANYKIEIIKADFSGFVAQATAVVDFDQDGVFNVWQVNQDKKIIEITKD